MKTTPTILALSLLLTACSRHDAEFTKQIPGTWNNTMTIGSNTLTIVPDGSFSYSRLAANQQHSWTNTGTWRITEGVVVMTATNRAGKESWALGDFLKLRIIHLDDQLWTYEMDGGATNSMSRQ